MKKKIIGIIVAIVIALGLSLVVYNQIISDEYVPAADEIALHIRLDTEADIGLLVYDYCADRHEYSGGISNADGSLIKHDSDMIVVWNKEELTKYMEPISWEAHLGESYFITITGDQTNGYKAVWNMAVDRTAHSKI